MGLSAIFKDNGINFISHFEPRNTAEIEFKNWMYMVWFVECDPKIKGKYSQKD